MTKQQKAFNILCSVSRYINFILANNDDNDEAIEIVQKLKLEMIDDVSVDDSMIDVTVGCAYGEKWENLRDAIRESFRY